MLDDDGTRKIYIDVAEFIPNVDYYTVITVCPASIEEEDKDLENLPNLSDRSKVVEFLYRHDHELYNILFPDDPIDSELDYTQPQPPLSIQSLFEKNRKRLPLEKQS